LKIKLDNLPFAKYITRMKNTKGLGKDQRAALKFYSDYSGWHSFASRCRATVRVIASLAKRGLLESNEFFQARFVENSAK
jgi:hypothetical protein